MHTELLAKASNKYDLVLQIARRAKRIKDDVARDGTPETVKPIPRAIGEMVSEQHEADALPEANA
ncbi:DNA-directed RNA polymerase subunit omega [compost metagenome]